MPGQMQLDCHLRDGTLLPVEKVETKMQISSTTKDESEKLMQKFAWRVRFWAGTWMLKTLRDSPSPPTPTPAMLHGTLFV